MCEARHRKWEIFCFLWHLVADATRLHDVNTTAGESTVFPCNLKTANPIAVNNLRFYWQDNSNHVWYSFNEGKEIMEHVNDLSQGRITAFPQDMTTGNISVKFRPNSGRQPKSFLGFRFLVRKRRANEIQTWTWRNLPNYFTCCR